jgi:hypothetical protein
VRRLSATAITALTTALIASPATAYADCGDPGQDPCADPVPTVDQVVAIMAELTDPNKPAADKGHIVTPAFSPDEARTLDNRLRRMAAVQIVPLPFVVTDIQPAPDNFAGATLATAGSFHQVSKAKPIVLVNQHGHWFLTHDSAMTEMDAFWYNARRDD